MTTLVKPMLTEYIPGTPGQPAVPYRPAQPARTIVVLVRVTTVDVSGPGNTDSLGLGGFGGFGDVTWVEVFQTIPATPAIPASPGIPPTPAQYNVYFDRAWNSAADSIAKIPPGSYIEYKVKPGSYGVFVGLASTSVYSTLPDSYPFGLMVDTSGVHVMEHGVLGEQLASGNTSETTLRILRAESGQVYYHVLGNPLVASPQAPVPSHQVMQASGLLYSSKDEVTDARIDVFSMIEGLVPFDMATDFVVMADPLAVFDITSEFLVSPVTEVVFSIDTAFSVTSSAVIAGSVTFPITTTFEAFPSDVGTGTWTLPAVILHGTDYDDPGFGTWILPRPTMTGTEQTYIPPAPTEGFWILPFVAMWGTGVDEDHGGGDWTLRAVAMIGTEAGVTYGQGNWTLPVRVVMRSTEPWWPADTLMLVSWLFEAPTLDMHTDLVLVLNSHGTLTSTVALTRVQLLSLLSAMSSSSSLVLSGIYSLSLLGNISVSSLQALRTLTGADLPSNAAVWVVNMDTSASAQYEDYGFNSFFRRGDDYYGVANDGIYRLSGETDEGSPIEAFAAFVRSTLGIQSGKHVPSVYIGAAADGALVLRVDVDGVARHYKARVATESLTNQRVDIGRGVRGVYWEFELLNQNGDDFSIADLTLIPLVRDRRI